jgi:hypothetical protein
LDALHRSYDEMLTQIELSVMVGRLGSLLDAMLVRLPASDNLSSETARDLDLFLSVGKGLLAGSYSAPVAGADPASVQAVYDKAMSAVGIDTVDLFGTARDLDFSQFAPRGHYEGHTILSRYFRAMIWFGRTDLRLIETRGDGSQVFRRRQFDAALGLRSLMGDDELASWHAVDDVVTAFVGEHDYMTIPEIDRLLAALGVVNGFDLAGRSDDEIQRAITDGGYGAQRIASQVMIKGAGAVGSLPLDRSFALFGQRYVIDSHVFSNLVMDRVGNGQVLRVLPNPLDAAFAALANDQAVSFLSEELGKYAYAPDLEIMRRLVDAHPASYWEGSLYTTWLGTLRTLSPNTASAGPAADGMPSVARSEAWGSRMLATQLGSWAQLRHDTWLYAKQSYTVGTVCEYPDAYVDPYPEFYASIARFAERARALISALPTPATSYWQEWVPAYLDSLKGTMATLKDMAEHQRSGMPHSAESVAFVNRAVRLFGGGSGAPSLEGWYPQLFLEPLRALEEDPTIADVHTDIGGDTPPRAASVLHVGTARPRLMVVTVNGCNGPRAYAGPVFSYHEVTEPGVTRLTDAVWGSRITSTPPAEVPGLARVVR